MIDYYFIIYGVFENGRCIMVGSTGQSLKTRAYGYRAYKWFNKKMHEHRILWEGTMSVCDKEQAHFIRAAKETMWIVRMKTWWPEGKNQASPITQVLGGPYSYEDRSRAIRSAAQHGRARWKKENPEKAFENSRKAGLIGGKKGGKLGGRRVRELYPGMAENNGHRQGLINAQNGNFLKTIGNKGRHTRWHANKNIVSTGCPFCEEKI